MIEETQNWLRSPERKAPKKEREYAIDRLNGVVKKIRNSMQNALNKLQTVLMKPSVKNAGKEKNQRESKGIHLFQTCKGKDFGRHRQSGKMGTAETSDKQKKGYGTLRHLPFSILRMSGAFCIWEVVKN